MKITIETDFRKLQSLSRTMERAAEMIEDNVPEELDDAAVKVETEARLNALRILPRRGGLAEEVASSDFSRRRQRAGMTTTVEVSAGSEYDLAGIDEGVLIHPVYGRPPWVQQSIQSGWFTGSLEDVEDNLVDNMDSLMRRAISIIR